MCFAFISSSRTFTEDSLNNQGIHSHQVSESATDRATDWESYKKCFMSILSDTSAYRRVFRKWFTRWNPPEEKNGYKISCNVGRQMGLLSDKDYKKMLSVHFIRHIIILACL
ncbi:hypothetical protein TNCV_3204741 [Trichonephila clavipes]|nr:hypothetical protein TNCV_3204741 [Trichonephila clavipes]